MLQKFINCFSDNMQVKEDTIFVSGLPDTADASQIGQFFGQIGIIKVPFIFIMLYVICRVWINL